MADPLSITSLVLQIGVTLKQLYDYGKQVKSAKAEMKQICLELSALRSLLDDLKLQGITDTKPAALSESLRDARAALEEISAALTPSSSTLNRIKQSVVWPLRNSDVTRILARLERAKTLLMLYLMGDLQMMRQDVSALTDLFQTVLISQDDQREAETRRKVIELIAPVSSQFAHRTACSVWEGSNPGLWFVEGSLEEFSTFSQPDWRILALVGISGSGKSTLLSKSIEHLFATSSQPIVAYMYCRYNDVETHKVRNILGGWLAQLLPLKPEIWEKFYIYLSSLEPVPIDALSGALVEIAESVGGIFLAVDALNECRESAHVASILANLADRSTFIRILISSVPSDLAISRLCHSELCRPVALTADKAHADIESYIGREVAKHRVLQRMDKDEIVDAVLTQADGMFRWAGCQMSLLAEQPTPKRVRKVLGHLPETLNDTYVALLQRVSESCKDIVREALLWLCLSQRPLKLRELIEIIAFEMDDIDLDEDGKIDPPARLLEMCHGLVVRDVATDNVSLAHGSILSFLTSDFIRTSPAAYYGVERSTGLCFIVRKCLSYLLMDQFGVGACQRTTFDRLQGDYPLLDYASRFWAVHAVAQESLTSEQVDLIQKLFRTHRLKKDASHFTFWVHCILPEADRNVISTAEPLYYAASFGLTKIVASMLENGMISLQNLHGSWYIDHSCGRATSTALQVACWRGHTEVASLLLEAGADPDSRNIVGASCLDCARRRGHSEIEQLLINKGAYDAPPPIETRPSPKVNVSIVRRIISEVLGVEPTFITDEAELVSLGVDSLVAVEIEFRLLKETGVRLEVWDLISGNVKELEDSMFRRP